MLRTLVEGEKWGALTCTYSGKLEVEIDEGGGSTWYGKVHSYVLKCSCGNEITIQREDFKGKQVVKDCGCGAAAGGAAVVVCISMPSELKLGLTKAAGKQGTSVSHLAATLISQGLSKGAKQ